MVSINCDMGEAFGLYHMGDDEALMPLISIANVACGFHASDFNHMRDTVKLAKRHGVKVGAHPSLPDLQGFGRREMKMSREEMANCVIYQVGALKGFLDAEGVELWGTGASGLPVDEVTAPPKLALAVGNEGAGLSSSVRDRVTQIVSLPISVNRRSATSQGLKPSPLSSTI